MSQEVSKWLVSGLEPQYTQFLSISVVGYNPFTNNLLSSWDIQAVVFVSAVA